MQDEQPIRINRARMRRKAELTDQVLKRLVNNPEFRARVLREREGIGMLALRRMAIEEGVISVEDRDTVGWRTLNQVLSRMADPTL